jgi:hypothetical protein
MLNKDQSSEREKFSAIYNAHIQKTYQFFELNKIPFQDVYYKDLIANPEVELKKIIQFLNLECDWKELAEVVNPELYRNKI